MEGGGKTEAQAAGGSSGQGSQPACHSPSRPPHRPACQSLCFCLSWEGGGVRLGALSDELSDNEFAPHGAGA